MVRAVALFILLASLAACTADAPGQGSDDAGPAGKLAGAFSLRAAGPFLTGEEPVLAVRSDAAGVLALRLFRAEDPVEAVAAFDDLGHPTVDGTVLGKALARASAGEDGGFSLVWTRPYPVADGRGTLSLGIVEPGFYLLEARAGSRAAHVPIVVSNLALVVKRGGDEVLIWVVRADVGRPVADASLTLVTDRGLRDLEVGSDGVARITLGDADDMRIVALAGGDVAVVDSTWLPPVSRNRFVHVMTDRPLYRPRERVGFKGIARRVVGDRMAPFGAVESVVLVPPRGDPIPFDGPTPEVTDHGTFSGEFELPEKAPHGLWRVVATVDGRRYGGEFQVKTYRRPEVRVDVTASSAHVLQGDPVAFRIAASYHAGGAVGGAKVSWSLHRTPRVRPAWRSPEVEEFIGELERRATKPVEAKKGQGELGPQGVLVVTVPTEKLDDDTAYVFTVRVRDETGRTIVGRGSTLAVRSLVTVDLRTDRESYEVGDPVVVTVRVRDRNRRPAATPLRLTQRFGEIDPVVREARTDENGLARLEIAADRAGALRLSVVALDDREREARTEKTVWVTEQGLAPGYGGEGISIIPDREIYATGDEARLLVLLPSSLGHAHLLVTVESDRLHAHRVELMEATSETIRVKIDRAYGSAFRVRATAMRYGRVFRGEARLLAPPVDRRLDVAVSLGAQTYRPGGRGFVTVRVTDHEGRPAPCELAVAGVDEALLALAPDLAPPVLRFFHGPRGDRVRTFTSTAVAFYDASRGVPDKAPEESSAAEADGEDDEMGSDRAPGRPATPSPGAARARKGKAAAPAEPPRANFAATALWAPHVQTMANGEAVIPVTFPDDLTRWRFAATAIDLAGRCGAGEGHATTTRPLRLTVATPRFMVERDRVTVPVVVRSPGHAREDVSCDLDIDPRLGVEVETRLDLRLDENARAAGAVELIGLFRGQFGITARASRGDDRDAVRVTIPVRAHGVSRASVLTVRLEDDRPWTGRLEVPPDARPGTVRVRLTFDPTRLAAIWRALDMLLGYPHGCTEQTLHRFLPDLQAQAAVTGLGLEAHPRADEIPGFVAAGVKRLVELQHADGGWGWWKDDATDPAMTALVLAGLDLAVEIGTDVPTEAIGRGVETLAALAKRSDLGDETRALILETIPDALPPAFMERLFDDETRLSASSHTLAILLSHFRNQDREAEVAVLTREILAMAKSGDGGTYWGTRRARRWQDDAVETTARVIGALAWDPAQRAVVEAAADWLLAQRDGGAWQSTRDSAAAVRALVTLAMNSPGATGRSAIRIRVDDGIVGQISVTADGWTGQPVVIELPPPLLTPGTVRHLTLERAGDLPVDVTAVMEYVSTREDLPAIAQGFAVERVIHRLEPVRRGERIVHERRDPAGTRVGDLLVLDVTIRPEKSGEFLECEVPYPAGCEPVDDPRVVALPEGDLPAIPDVHVERRDDAAWFFLRRVGAGPVRFRILLRVTHAGDFHVLPVRAGLMYFPHVHGSSPEARLTFEEDRR